MIYWRMYGTVLAVCSSGCYNGGMCTAPNTCMCTSGWTGPTCTTGNNNYCADYWSDESLNDF